MFDNPRYVTRGISERIPLELQILMWTAIDEMKVKKKDYLQVFRFSLGIENGEEFQYVEHSQEQPEYNKKFKLNAVNAVCEKVYVIDDQTHSTMLLAEEY